MARLPTINPISEGWFGRGTPLDHVGETEDLCASCGAITVQDRYQAMLGRHGGLGVPFFLRPLTTRSSLRGKWGKRSAWAQCRRCRSVLPRDAAAQELADRLGRSDGFLDSAED